MFRMTGANLCTKSLSSLFGMLLGPTAFATLSDNRDRNTSLLETKSSCGTRLGGESQVEGVKWSVRLFLQVIWYSWYPQETDGTAPADCLGL